MRPGTERRLSFRLGVAISHPEGRAWGMVAVLLVFRQWYAAL
jgi:hypothetical protein